MLCRKARPPNTRAAVYRGPARCRSSARASFLRSPFRARRRQTGLLRRRTDRPRRWSRRAGARRGRAETRGARAASAADSGFAVREKSPRVKTCERRRPFSSGRFEPITVPIFRHAQQFCVRHLDNGKHLAAFRDEGFIRMPDNFECAPEPDAFETIEPAFDRELIAELRRAPII